MTDVLPVLYCDEHLVAVHKPAGLLVHRTGIDRNETRFAVQMLRDQLGQHVYPVHRLDKGTSGVLLFARHPEMARQLVQQFAEQKIDKCYWAVVRGHPPEQGRIDHPLDRIQDDYDKQTRADAPAQPAVTDYRRLACVELPVAVDRYPVSRYALLALSPLTGRRHQLRRHLKHIAHPIIGDVRYGKGSHNRYFREHLAAPRMLLACVRMRLAHPVTGATLVLEQPVDGCFQALLQRWQWPTDVNNA
ncbi:MAG: pseudouridine synthase [Pseudomonadota bacterium]